MPYTSIKGQEIYFQDIGQGFPLLLLHSYLWDSHMWRPQLETLSQQYRLIVPDLWGHGRSDSLPEIPYSLSDLADDMHTLLLSLNIKSYAIVGLSVGGMIAPLIANRPKPTCQGMVLMDTFLGEEASETKQTYFNMLDVIQSEGKIPTEIIERILPLFFSPTTIANNPDIIRPFIDRLAKPDIEQLPSTVALGRAIFGRDNLLPILAKINIPSLVMVGEHDIPRPVQESQQMVDLLNNARLSVVPNAGHIANMENPTFVTEQITAFLNESPLEAH